MAIAITRRHLDANTEIPEKAQRYRVRPCSLFLEMDHSLMVRPWRIEFDGAIYHLMARGNARQAIFSDDVDRQRLLDSLKHHLRQIESELRQETKNKA